MGDIFFKMFFAAWVTYEALEALIGVHAVFKDGDLDCIGNQGRRILAILVVFLVGSGGWYLCATLKNL